VSALKSSLIVSISSALLTVIAALPAGYALARFHFFGRRFLLTAILAGLMFSPVVVLISIYQILFTVGLMNTYFALILPNTAFALPFSIWLTMAYVKSLPTEIDESAVLDGAGYSRILFTIVTPLIAPSVVTVFVYAFIQSWNEFLFSKTFITSESLKTLPVRLYEFVGYRGIEWQYMTASIVVTTVPCIILFFSVQRWLVKGLVSGAVRG
jgi:ABC-type glycerol-3-phosphate transport system permease component